MADRPSIKDIVEFAKAGWKPAEVKEILEAASRQEVKPEEEPAAADPKEDTQPEQEKQEEPKADDASKDKEIEQLKLKLEEASKKLSTVQETNTKKNLQSTVPEKSEEDKLNDIARSFM